MDGGHDYGIARAIIVLLDWRQRRRARNGPSSNYDMYYCWDGAAPQKMYGPTWVARSSTSTLSGFFSVAGVGLDTSQENSGYHKLTWGPDAASSYVKVCGSNSDPLHAKKVREVNY